MINAVVLAGAPNTGRLRECSDAPNEALIEIDGRPMISYIIDALVASGVIGRIAVVCTNDVALAMGDAQVEVVESRGSLMDNLVTGLAGSARSTGSDNKRVLVTTSDIPFLTPECVRDFVSRCGGSAMAGIAAAPGAMSGGRSGDADIYYPIVARSVIEGRYPGVERTFFRLVDGEFTGGNAVILNPDRLLASQELIRSAIALRKKPLALARMLGLSFIVRFIFKQLRIVDIEKRAGAMLGLVGRVVVTPFPELGVDVDKPSDLELARRLLTNSGTSG